MTGADPRFVTARLPLAGKVIVLSRAREQAGDFEERIRALGGEPVIAPAITIAPPTSWAPADAAFRRLPSYGWVTFTSANAVAAVVSRLGELRISIDHLADARLAAVGPETGAAIRRLIRAPDLVATTHLAEALARELPEPLGERVLFPCGELARDILVTTLRARGAVVDPVVVYRTLPGEGIEAIVRRVRDGSVDALLLSSPSAVDFIADALSGLTGPGTRLLVFCIGPVTARAAGAAGFTPVPIESGSTQVELVEAVARWFAARKE